MYKTERPFRVDVHRNSLFFVRGGEGRGGWCFVFCVVQILSGRYIHHTTYISHTCNFPCSKVDFLFIYYIYAYVPIVREVLISRDSGREVGREDPIR